MRNAIRYIIIICAVICFCNCKQPPTPIRHSSQQPAKKDTAKNETVPAKQTPDTIITIAAVGDMMLGTAYPDESHLPPDSAKGSFKYALKHLREADVTFGNLEGVLLDSGAALQMKLNFRSKPYLFKMPEHYGRIFKDAGFDVISVANNHSNDFGIAGRKKTIGILDSLGIHHAGLRSNPTKLFTIKDVKYGFCAFSPNSQTVPLLDTKNATKIIQQLKEQADIVIVSFHGGGEGVDFEHVSCTNERFKGERRGNVNAFAHAAIDAGADIVLGHGPHVARAMELYNNRLIAYSLGNFCTYRSVSVSGICGLSPLLKVHLNKKGHFLDGHIISYQQTHAGGLVPDSLNKAAARIKMLTQTDFGASGLEISSTGKISRGTQNLN